MGTAFLMGGAGERHKLTVVKIETSGQWTVPPNVTRLLVWMCGGGSQGVIWDATGSSNDYGAGGTGAAPREYVINVTPGQVFNVVIGAGGGSSGGQTSFGVYTAPGGYVGKHTDSNAYDIVGTTWGGTFYTGSFAMSSGENGNAGTAESYGRGLGGYCWLTDDIYCGGGGCIHTEVGTTTGYWSATGGPTTQTIGGGAAMPQVTCTWTGSAATITVVGNVIPANKYGAGGITIGGLAMTGDYGDLGNPAKLLGYQGVVIIGY